MKRAGSTPVIWAASLTSGDLVLTGRAKDTIVLASGENVEPEPIEERIKSSRYIDQVMVVGQDQEFLAALVVPSFPELRAWARRQRLRHDSDEALVADPAVAGLIREQVGRRAGSVAGGRPSDVVKRFHLVPREFSLEDGTPHSDPEGAAVPGGIALCRRDPGSVSGDADADGRSLQHPLKPR